MQVACDPAIAGDILGKLKDLNRKSKIVEPFVNDYEIVLRKCRVLEVQVGQLSRESTELREEVLEKEKILAEVAEKVQKIHLVESLAAELKKVWLGVGEWKCWRCCETPKAGLDVNTGMLIVVSGTRNIVRGLLYL